MMEAVVTIGAINRAKLQSNHHHQQTNTHTHNAYVAHCTVQTGSWVMGQRSRSGEVVTVSHTGVSVTVRVRSVTCESVR